MMLRLQNQPLWVEITLLFLVKMCALYVLWYFCFSPSHKIPVSSEKTVEHILQQKGEAHA